MRLKIDGKNKIIKVSDLFNDCTKSWNTMAEELICCANDNKDFLFIVSEDSCIETESFNKLFAASNIIAEVAGSTKQHEFDAGVFRKCIFEINDVSRDNYLHAVDTFSKAIKELSKGRYMKAESISKKERQILALSDGRGYCEVVWALVHNEDERASTSDAGLRLSFEQAGLSFYSLGCFPKIIWFKDGESCLSFYSQNTPVCNGYFDHANTDKIIKAAGLSGIACEVEEIKQYCGRRKDYFVSLRIKDTEGFFDRIKEGKKLEADCSNFYYNKEVIPNCEWNTRWSVLVK